jgi:uncharacterized membrane protein YfcA
MQLHDVLLALIAFVSELLGTLSGFGSSTFFVPSALLFESAQFVLALTGILHCFGNLSKIVLFRKNFEWKSFWLLCVPFVFATGIGALLVVESGAEKVRPVLGTFLVVYALFSLVKPFRRPRFPRWVAMLLSGVSGLATGFIGTGGAIRGIALTALQMPKNSFVAISSAIDIGGDLLRTAIYLENGFMNWDQWFYIPVLAVAAYGGAHAGHIFLGRIKQNQFEKVVSFFILISGVLLLF